MSATLAILLHVHQGNCVTYDVMPGGKGSGVEYDLSDALALAGPGDIVSLGGGTYDSSVVSVNNGEPGKPIAITGGPNAVIKASSPSVLIRHSWITLQAG